MNIASPLLRQVLRNTAVAVARTTGMGLLTARVVAVDAYAGQAR